MTISRSIYTSRCEHQSIADCTEECSYVSSPSGGTTNTSGYANGAEVMKSGVVENWEGPHPAGLPKRWLGRYTIYDSYARCVTIHLGCEVDHGRAPAYWALIEKDDEPGSKKRSVILVVSPEAVGKAYQAALASKRVDPGLEGMRRILIEIWDELLTDDTPQGLPTWMTYRKVEMRQKLTEAVNVCSEVQEAIDARAVLMGCPQP